MKTYTKTIWNICACMLIILLGGCADDDIIRNDCGSTLQETESHLISTFSLPEGKTPIQDTREQIFFQLRSLSDNSIQLMEGKIRKNAGILSCEMFIPNNLVLEDGDYILWLKFDEEGSVYPLSYHLTFRDKMVSMVRDTKYIYEMLNGEGTEENPYLITSTNDFAYLVSQLATYDRNYGYGQFFKQIADIKAPIPNCLYQGNAYKSAPFAGNYDGDSHKILNLTYLGTNGGEQSDAIGLFSILHDGAVIRNLDIEGADIEYPGNCCGLLAGVANGNIRIENITLNGNIKSTKDKVGGLIGYIEGNAQSLAQISIRNVRLGVSFSESGSSYIGALYNGTLTGTYKPEFNAANVIVSKIPRPIFPGNINSEKPYRENAAYVGGIVGYADKSTLRRLFTQPSIYGRSTVGGIIGYASDTQISDCGVKTETFNNGNNSAIMVGGIIGQASCSSHCEFSNLVNYSDISSGSNYIGGIFGSMVARTTVKINKVVNLGKLSATNNIGGIIGKNAGKGIEVYDAANFGTIQGIAGDKEYGVGGIAGASEDAITIYKSVNHGNITINRNAKYYGAGGILGYVKQGGAHIRYCCNRANIDYPKDKEDSHGIGGIVGSIEKASDNDDSYVLDCYNMGEINGQQKATGTLGSDYRGGIVGNLGSHGRCYRAVNGGYVRFGNAGVGNGNKKNLTHIYILPGTGKDFGATYIPQPTREDKNIYQGFDFTGDHDPNRQPVWVLGGTYSSENKMLPYLHSGKCYFQFAKYAP